MIEAGAINAWVCETCGQATVAIHRDEGVTPMLLACRATDGCQGVGRSMFYRPGPWSAMPPTHEWYRPEKRERRRLVLELRDHVDAGGLLIRRVTGEPIAVERCRCVLPALQGHSSHCSGVEG